MSLLCLDTLATTSQLQPLHLRMLSYAIPWLQFCCVMAVHSCTVYGVALSVFMML